MPGFILKKRAMPPEIDKVFALLDWSAVPAKDKQACQLISMLFSELEPQLQNGLNLIELLNKRKWPLVESLNMLKNPGQPEDTGDLLMALTQQIYSAVKQLDTDDNLIPFKDDAQINARLISAYFRIFSIHLSSIIPTIEEKEMQQHLRVYHASRIFAQKVNESLAPLDNWDLRQQTALIRSLPNNSVTLGQIEDAYKAMLKQIGQKEEQGHIPQENLAMAYSLFVPLSGIRELPISNLEKSLNAEPVCFESPVTSRKIGMPSQKKLEDNLPKATLALNEDGKTEYIPLTYDPFGAGLRWPAFEGKYLLRFQPKFQTIPYRVRLREARQINYANSSQPYSFESDLIISDTSNPELLPEEKTISMNNVHESWDGYRFYLASIDPAFPGAVKKVQIVVNHDPAKYILTYPGAIILSLGIILLFWLKPYSKK